MPETPAWYMEFVAAVVARLPRDIDEAVARQWVGSPEHLEEALAGALVVAAVASVDPDSPFLNDKRSEGMELLEDVSEPAQLATENIGEVVIFGDDEPFAVGDDVVERVRSMSPKFGQRHCEYLHAHPEMIPEEYNRYTLVFGGTIWRDQAGNHMVPCLHRSQGEWKIIFGILEMGMDNTDRMATPVGEAPVERPRSPTAPPPRQPSLPATTSTRTHPSSTTSRPRGLSSSRTCLSPPSSPWRTSAIRRSATTSPSRLATMSSNGSIDVAQVRPAPLRVPARPPEMIPEEYNRYTLVPIWRDQAGNHIRATAARACRPEMGMDNTDRMATPVGEVMSPKLAASATDVVRV